MRDMLSSKAVQIVLLILGATAILAILLPSHANNFDVKRKHYAKVKESPAEVYSPKDIIDYRRCPKQESMRIYVHDYDHPLAVVSIVHSSNGNSRCVRSLSLRLLMDGEDEWLPFSWYSVAEPGLNHVIVNLNEVPIECAGREMIVQANFEKGTFRPLLDIFLSFNASSNDVQALSKSLVSTLTERVRAGRPHAKGRRS